MLDKAKLSELIQASHPVTLDRALPDGTPDDRKVTHEQMILRAYKCDAVAMDLVHDRHSKRELVDLVRFLIMNAKEGVLPEI